MTIAQYFKRYYELLPYHKNGEETYNALEAEFFAIYKRYRFNSYNSFKRSKSYYFGQY